MGHLSIVKYLHSVGADPTAENNYAIKWASIYGHRLIFEYLQMNGCHL